MAQRRHRAVVADVHLVDRTEVTAHQLTHPPGERTDTLRQVDRRPARARGGEQRRQVVQRRPDHIHAGTGAQIATAHGDERVGGGQGVRGRAEATPSAERPGSHPEPGERGAGRLAVGAATRRAELDDVRQIGKRGGIHRDDRDVLGRHARAGQPLHGEIDEQPVAGVDPAVRVDDRDHARAAAASSRA